MCDKAVDDCLTPLKFVPDWLVTSECCVRRQKYTLL